MTDTPAAATLHCHRCNTEIYSDMKFCPKCKARQGALAGSASGNATTSNVLAIVGGALLAVAPFMPWATVGALSADGMQKTGSEAIVLTAVGVGALIVAILALTKKTTSATLLTVLGVGGAGASLYYYSQIKEQLDSIGEGIIQPAVGFGLYASILGGVLLLVGGLIGFSADRGRK